MTSFLRRRALLLSVGAVIGMTGCNVAPMPLGLPMLQLPGSATSVREIQSQSPPEVNSTVYLTGRVGDRIPLINAQLYQLQDSTGTIWVITNNPLTESGGTVSVQGRLQYQSIPLAGREQGEVYVEEQQRQYG